MEEYINQTIAEMIRGDGGWVEFMSYENNVLRLLFRAECSKCIILERCCDFIKEKIKQDLGETVVIEAVQKKPFFWDV